MRRAAPHIQNPPATSRRIKTKARLKSKLTLEGVEEFRPLPAAAEAADAADSREGKLLHQGAVAEPLGGEWGGESGVRARGESGVHARANLLRSTWITEREPRCGCFHSLVQRQRAPHVPQVAQGQVVALEGHW
jgi:hypothetical protein